jgi:hypothetical protein
MKRTTDATILVAALLMAGVSGSACFVGALRSSGTDQTLYFVFGGAAAAALIFACLAGFLARHGG